MAAEAAEAALLAEEGTVARDDILLACSYHEVVDLTLSDPEFDHRKLQVKRAITEKKKTQKRKNGY